MVQILGRHQKWNGCTPKLVPKKWHVHQSTPAATVFMVEGAGHSPPVKYEPPSSLINPALCNPSAKHKKLCQIAIGCSQPWPNHTETTSYQPWPIR